MEWTIGLLGTSIHEQRFERLEAQKTDILLTFEINQRDSLVWKIGTLYSNSYCIGLIRAGHSKILII